MSWLKAKRHTKVSCDKIVDAYGAVLERVPYGVGCSLPASELPYDEGVIKEALASLANETGDEGRKTLLKAGFLELAAFVDDGYAPIRSTGTEKRLPTTRTEVREFFENNGDGLADEHDLAQRIFAKREVLEAEWPLRLTLCSVSRSKRIGA